jgi:hypothetical protein
MARLHSIPPGALPDGTPWLGSFDKRYNSSVSGCSVYSEANWTAAPHSEEEQIAQLLADSGRDVVLLKISSSQVKNPDAYLITGEGTSLWEFERVTQDAQNLPRAISQALRAGKKQAENVVLYVDRNDVSDDILRRGIRSAFLADEKAELNAVMILRRDGMSRLLPRTEVIDHENFSL